MLVVLSIINIFRSIEKNTVKPNLKVFSYISLIIVYIFIAQIIGYFVSTVAFIFMSLFFLKERSIVKLVVLPTVTSLVIYLVFNLFLQVPLPHGIIF